MRAKTALPSGLKISLIGMLVLLSPIVGSSVLEALGRARLPAQAAFWIAALGAVIILVGLVARLRTLQRR